MNALHNSLERGQLAVIKKLIDWIRGDIDFDVLILWVYGETRAGKYMIAHALVEICKRHGWLLETFFWKIAVERKIVHRSITAMACQISLAIPASRPLIEDAINSDAMLIHQSVDTQLSKLIVEPLRRLKSTGFDFIACPFVIIIDGLDECQDNDIQSGTVKSLAVAFHRSPLRIRILIASRPEVYLHSPSILQSRPSRLALPSEYFPNEDIRQILRDSFRKIRRQHPLASYIPSGRPSTDTGHEPNRNGTEQFGFASTTIKCTGGDPHELPHHRLYVIHQLQPPRSNEVLPYAELNSLCHHTTSNGSDNGNSFSHRFRRTGDLNDISKAISVWQRAVQLTPDGHANMPGQLMNLGISYLSRFECTGDVSDISEATSVQQRAVQLTPNGHADMPGLLNNLGNSYLGRFEHTGDVSDQYTAISTFRKSATTFGPPSTRAQLWAQLSEILCLPQTLTAYGVSLGIITQIASLDRTIQQRNLDLIEFSSLTASAASAAFTLGDVDEALEWLEQGRCLVWSQLNQLRTPLDHLCAHDEHLARPFSDISGALEASGSHRRSEGLGQDTSLSQKISLQDEAYIHIKLSREWSELLEEIRRIPQFHDFLRPPQASYLLEHLPPKGIVILVNVHKDHSDALALISGVGAPLHVALDFTYNEASKLGERLFLSSYGVRTREGDRDGRPIRNPDAEKQSNIHFVLEVLWLRVVRPILDGLAFSVSVSQFMTYHFINISFKSTPPLDPSRIWWCPTGPLTFLPLHAAGIYSQNGRSPPGSSIFDFAISSYTPTVSSLIQKHTRSDKKQQLASSKLLIISQPKTPGCPPIPATTKEMNCISKVFGSFDAEPLCLEGESASVTRVKLEMESHGSVHFACHATQDFENPLKNGFYLHDGRLELADIMKQKFAVRELAFLSACQTSTGDEKLLEEGVYLASGMLAAGYRSVVATMWSVKDQYGPVVAESFYRYLMERGETSEGSQLDGSHAAYALHHTIQDIREKVGDTEQGLLTWVPYVHFGY